MISLEKLYRVFPEAIPSLKSPDDTGCTWFLLHPLTSFTLNFRTNS